MKRDQAVDTTIYIIGACMLRGPLALNVLDLEELIKKFDYAIICQELCALTYSDKFISPASRSSTKFEYCLSLF